MPMEFQSPRSGKFVSNTANNITELARENPFQSPRSGEFVSNLVWEDGNTERSLFQSPRSGKFVSDLGIMNL